VNGSTPIHNKANSKLYNVNYPITNPAINAKFNPINGPIYRAEMKRQRSVDARDFYANHPGFGGVLLSEVELDELAGNFYTTFPIPLLNGLTLQAAMISQTFMVYIGIKVHSLIHLFTYSLHIHSGTTMRLLKEEDLRWLTARGANTDAGRENGQRNRPVLVYPNDKHIKMKEARINLGAISVIIKSFATRFEATGFEDRLQVLLNGYPLGHRLHRAVAMGQHIDDVFPNPITHVFLTAIPIVPGTLQYDTVTTATNVVLKIVH
jgi:hypothetical protein